MGYDIAAVATTKVAMNWRQQYTTEGLNKKFRTDPRGIARGFGVTPSGSPDNSVTIGMDALTGDAAMVVSAKGGEFAISYHERAGAFALTLPSSTNADVIAEGLSPGDWIYVGVEHNYTTGATTAVKWRWWTPTEWGAGDTEDGVLVCRAKIKTPASTYTDSDIEVLKVADYQDRWRGDHGAAPALEPIVGLTMTGYDDENVYSGTRTSTVSAPVAIAGKTSAVVLEYPVPGAILGQVGAGDLGRVRVSPGERVLLQGWVLAETGTVVNAATALKFNFIQLNGALVSAVSLAISPTPGAGWQFFEQEYVVPALTGYISDLSFLLAFHSGAMALDSLKILARRTATDQPRFFDDLSRGFTTVGARQFYLTQEGVGNAGYKVSEETYGGYSRIRVFSGRGGSSVVHNRRMEIGRITDDSVNEAMHLQVAGVVSSVGSTNSSEGQRGLFIATRSGFAVANDVVAEFSARSMKPDENSGDFSMGYEAGALKFVALDTFGAGNHQTGLEVWLGNDSDLSADYDKIFSLKNDNNRNDIEYFNPQQNDGSGARAHYTRWYGKTLAGVQHEMARMAVYHPGTSADHKGYFKLQTNDGADTFYDGIILNELGRVLLNYSQMQKVALDDGTTKRRLLINVATGEIQADNVSYSAYTTANVTPDRAIDADATTLDEVADVLGTLIADLQAQGIIG